MALEDLSRQVIPSWFQLLLILILLLNYPLSAELIMFSNLYSVVVCTMEWNRWPLPSDEAGRIPYELNSDQLGEC